MTIKQKIWDKMEKDGYITDQELALIYGKEPNFYTAEIYKTQWRNFTYDRDFFKNKDIVEKSHHCRRYLVRLKGMTSWYTVHKEFYQSIVI